MTGKPDLDFKSPKEFRAVCRYLSLRLGYIHRVAMGEQWLVIALSKMLDGVGQAFVTGNGDKTILAHFGDGWTEGQVPRGAERDALLDLIEKRGAFAPEVNAGPLPPGEKD